MWERFFRSDVRELPRHLRRSRTSSASLFRIFSLASESVVGGNNGRRIPRGLEGWGKIRALRMSHEATDISPTDKRHKRPWMLGISAIKASLHAGLPSCNLRRDYDVRLGNFSGNLSFFLLSSSGEVAGSSAYRFELPSYRSAIISRPRIIDVIYSDNDNWILSRH